MSYSGPLPSDMRNTKTKARMENGEMMQTQAEVREEKLVPVPFSVKQIPE
jgi:hypothetical protein